MGRESILEELLSKIPPSLNRHDCQWTAIEGLGGIGKTQIALEAVFRVRDRYPNCHIFWVPAIDVTTFENAYREIGRQLELPGLGEDNGNTNLTVKTGLSQLADDWLLVIDNADDIELLFGPTGTRPLSDYFPSSHKGSILFTTRNHEAVRKLDVPRADVIRVTDMSRQEASKMLQNQLDVAQISDPGSLTELLDFLADLPLAIKQAAAYLDKTGMTVRQYLDHCRSGDERFISLLSKDFNDRGRYKVARNPIATTWLISFDQISRDDMLAARYLKIMSLVAEKNIPENLIPSHTDQLERTEAIGTLKAYAFITQRSGQQSYDMHRLVRLALQKWLTENGELEGYLSTVMRQLVELCPWPRHQTRAVVMAYLPHIMAALTVSHHEHGDSSLKEELLKTATQANSLARKYNEAEMFCRKLYELGVQRLGADHICTIEAIRGIAIQLAQQGRDVEAEPLYQKVVSQYTQKLGTEHPRTLRSMDDLAYSRTKLGKHNEAELMYREVIQYRTRLFGEADPNTLNTMHCLAIGQRIQGRVEEAEKIFQKVIKIRTEILGMEHPDTVRSMLSLANTHFRQGKYLDAESIYRQVLEIQLKLLGTEHPDTLETSIGLGCALESQGKHEEAEARLRKSVALITKVYDPGHGNTFQLMNYLASAVKAQGREDEAEEICRQAMGAKVMLGHERFQHHIRDQLVRMLRKQGRDGEAEQVLADAR